DNTLFVTLTENLYRAFKLIDVSFVQIEQFRKSDACSIQQLEHKPVSPSGEAVFKREFVQKSAHTLFLNENRKAFPSFERIEFLKMIDIYYSPFLQKLKICSKGSKFSIDRAGRYTNFHQVNYPCTDVDKFCLSRVYAWIGF